MPILAAFPVAAIPPERDYTRQDTRTLAFRTLGGEYPFPSTGKEFFFMPDIEGIDMAPREVISKPVPGMEGTRLREIRIQQREVFLPLWMSADSSHLQYLDRRDSLAALFNHRLVDYRAEDGTLDLVASSDRGERSLRCVYVSGMTAGKWPNEGATWAKLGVTLWACRPYWYGVPWETPVIQKPASEAFFGHFPPHLSTSRALGDDIPVKVAGDVESWVTVDLVGPATSVTISGPGLLVTIPAGLGNDEPCKIVTDPRGRIALFDGAVDWSRVGPSTTWRALPPGDQLLTINMAGADEGTRAVASGPTLFERPW